MPVDTIICFRASCPLVIAVIEYFYLDRELPSLRSWLSLGGESSFPTRHFAMHVIVRLRHMTVLINRITCPTPKLPL